MTTQNTEIFNHDSNVDISHKINTMELNSWIDQLKYIKRELKNLLNTCNKYLSHKTVNVSLMKSFQKKAIENDTLLNALTKYSNSRSNIIECEDTECDMVYITEHEKYRKNYVLFLENYRKLKDEFFTKM